MNEVWSGCVVTEVFSRSICEIGRRDAPCEKAIDSFHSSHCLSLKISFV